MTDPTRHLHAVAEQPHTLLADTRAEMAVLGAIMSSATVADQIIDKVRAADFYHPRHATIYAAAVATSTDGQPVDPITLAHALAQAGELDRIGGAAYLHDLLAAVPTVATGPYYARIIADWATRRRLREVAIRLDQHAGDLTRDITDLIQTAQQAVHEATMPRARDAARTFAELLPAVLADILNPTPAPLGLSTGLGALDDAIIGLAPGQLVIVAARPGVGKSILTTGFARTAALHLGVPALTFSLEMFGTELMHRIMAAATGINLTAIRTGRLTDDQRTRLATKTEAVAGAPLAINDTRHLDIGTLRALARRHQQRHGLGLLVVDYLQLVKPSRTAERRDLELDEVTWGLKALAGELAIPVVAAAQLNRLAEQRADRRPQLSDLRESGSLEQTADVVILIHRPDYQNPEHHRAGEADLIIAKNRNGPEETVTVCAQLDRARFVDFRR